MVKQIESGLAKQLSVAMARRIVAHTGVNFRWLVQGDPKEPMLDVFGQPYRKEFYQELFGEFTGQRRVSRHDPQLIKFSAYLALRKILLLVLDAAEKRRVLSLVTQLHAFLDELDYDQGFHLSPRLANELSQAIVHDTMREKPNPVRFVSTQDPNPGLGIRGGSRFNVSAYKKAQSRYCGKLELIAVFNQFGGELDSLITAQRQDPKLARGRLADRLPQLMTSTAMLLPVASTKLKGAPRNDYRRIAKDALDQDDVIRIVHQLRSPGIVTAKLIKQLKQAKVPPVAVDCFERLKKLKSRKVTIIKSPNMPSPVTKVSKSAAKLRSSATGRASRRLR